MDYQKIYTQLINRAKHVNRKKGCGVYFELHHIVPKCIGGTENKDNLVLLTAREHFIAHKLLCEIYPTNDKLFHAYWMMCTCKTPNRMYKISSREYSRIKQKFSESISKLNTGELNPAKRTDVRNKISQALMGHTAWNNGLTKETNNSIAQMAVKQKNIKRWNVGLTKNDPRVLEQSKKSSQTRTGKTRGNYNVRYGTCIYCNYNSTVSVINRKHNDKCKYKF